MSRPVKHGSPSAFHTLYTPPPRTQVAGPTTRVPRRLDARRYRSRPSRYGAILRVLCTAIHQNLRTARSFFLQPLRALRVPVFLRAPPRTAHDQVLRAASSVPCGSRPGPSVAAATLRSGVPSHVMRLDPDLRRSASGLASRVRPDICVHRRHLRIHRFGCRYAALCHRRHLRLPAPASAFSRVGCGIAALRGLRGLCVHAFPRRARNRGQVVRWSLTSPTACM